MWNDLAYQRFFRNKKCRVWRWVDTPVRHDLNEDQCDQKARLFHHFLAIYDIEIFLNLPKKFQNFTPIQNKPLFKCQIILNCCQSGEI